MGTWAVDKQHSALGIGHWARHNVHGAMGTTGHWVQGNSTTVDR
ncbi:hypothetical protein [Paenibacillus sp. 19GGS1-52]|nr:hypothetical protein [Paenibacillus sp. 19GGS1-52]